MITSATSFVCKGPPSKTNSNIKCLPNLKNQPHPVESNEDSTPESISDTKDWLHRNGDLGNANDSEDNCPVDDESDINQHIGIENPECPEQHDVSAAPNVQGLVWPTRKSKRQVEQALVTVNAIGTRRNKGVNTL